MMINKIISTILATATLFALGLTTHASAAETLTDEPVVRGEVARLLRQAYDYEHRNSNNNVFRRSKHFHPTRNVFRSSRHYQQKLAASSDGYPLRSTTRLARTVDGGKAKLIEYSFAHHRRSPFGLPSVEERGLEALVLSGDNRVVGRAGADDYYVLESSDRATRPFDAPDACKEDFPRDKPAAEPEGNDRPMRTAVTTTTTLPDGSTKIIITSAPLEYPPAREEHTLNAAWDSFNGGNVARAAEIFLKQTVDVERGAEALAGYGLAKLLAGDIDESARALRRAARIDEHILSRLMLQQECRDRLAGLRAGLSGIANVSQDDRAIVESALVRLLD